MGKARLPKSSLAESMYDHKIENMIYLEEQGRKKRHLSRCMTRPAYAYTNQEQKFLFAPPECEPCGYYQESEIGDMECTFPWDNPDDYDTAVFDYLPCQREVDHEED